MNFYYFIKKKINTKKLLQMLFPEQFWKYWYLLALKFIQLSLQYIFPFKWKEIQSKTTGSYYWLLAGITSKSDFFFKNMFWVIFLWSKSNADFPHKKHIRSQ